MGNCVSHSASPDAALLSHAAGEGPQRVSSGFAEAFLGYIGLSIYAQAFAMCDYDTEALLCHLDMMDLDKIERASHVPILASHREQILQASAKLQEFRQRMWTNRSEALSLLLESPAPALAAGHSPQLDSSHNSTSSSFSSTALPPPRKRQVIARSPARPSQQQQQQQHGQRLQKEDLPLLMQHMRQSRNSSSSSEWLNAWVPADTSEQSSADAAARASTRASDQAVAVVFGAVHGSKGTSGQQRGTSRQRAWQQYSMLPEMDAEPMTAGVFTKMTPTLQSGYVQFMPCLPDDAQLSDSACSSDFMQR